MGGGTCGVEALAEGRRFLGGDVNQLAYFISRVKTNALSAHDEACVLVWASALPSSIDLSAPDISDQPWVAYQKNLPWRLRKLLSQALATLEVFSNGSQREFARCALLCTAQRVLDCKSKIPSKEDFLTKYLEVVSDMLVGQGEFKDRFISATGGQTAITKVRQLLCADASRLHTLKRAHALGTPKLVLTSPPYLGVHVLYHRWQILGRKETSAPYWLANKLDGHMGTFYTFADRRAKTPDRYLEKLLECFKSVTRLMTKNTLVMQLVAFPDADVQLPLYLETLQRAGLQKCDVLERNTASVPVSREVPNRRWYALVTNQTNSSTEFLLVHRLAK